MLMGKFIVYKGIGSLYYYYFVSCSGIKILSGGGFHTLESGKEHIRNIIKNLSLNPIFPERKSGERYFFIIETSSGDIIDVSVKFETFIQMDACRKLLQKEAPGAGIEIIS